MQYETFVPMRTIDEWILWSFLEGMFGDDTKFSVVQRRGNLQISTPSPLSASEILKKCRF